MNNHKDCIKPDCRLPAIHNSDFCWEHLKDRDAYRLKLEQDVLNGVDFSDACFRGVDLRGLNLSGMKAPRTDFSGADLYKVSFAGATLNNSLFSRSRVNYTSFDLADMRNSCLNNCLGKTPNFIGANLRQCEAKYTVITDANLSEANMELSNWQGSTLSFCDLTRVKAAKIHAPWSNLMGTILKHGEFEFAVLGGCMMDGVQATEANFNRANLLGVSARAGSFNESSFYYARLTAGIFVGADFTNADLTRAVLRVTSFFDARMDDAKMEAAVLDRAKF